MKKSTISKLGLVAAFSSFCAAAQVSDNFEAYTDGQVLDGVNGWKWGAKASIENNSYYDSNIGYPIEGKHTTVMKVNGITENRTVSDSSMVVTADMIIKPGDFRSAAAGNPALDSDSALGFYVNSSGHPVVAHAGYGGSTVVWSEITAVTLPATEWHRVTVALDYRPFDTVENHLYFSIMVNGEYLASPAARSDQKGTDSGGIWFPMLNSSRLTGVSFAGNSAAVDDMVLGGASASYSKLSIADSSCYEPADGQTVNADFVVTLSEPSDKDITVDYQTKDGTAVAVADYVAEAGRLVIPAGAIQASISVAVNGDAVDDSGEKLSLVLTGAKYAVIAKSQGFCTIADDSGDSDYDKVINADEVAAGTDPFNWDSDGDSYSDYIELLDGSDPLDSLSHPVHKINLAPVMIGTDAGFKLFGESVKKGASQHMERWNGSTITMTPYEDAVQSSFDANGYAFGVKGLKFMNPKSVELSFDRDTYFTGLGFGSWGGSEGCRISGSAVSRLNGLDDTEDSTFSLDTVAGSLTINGPASPVDIVDHVTGRGIPVKAGETLKVTFLNGTAGLSYLNFHEDVKLYEDAQIGDLVVENVAYDPNGNDVLTYAITAGNESGMFAISQNGKVTVMGALDYKTASVYTLTIQATDLAGLTSKGSIVVDVLPTDADEDGLDDRWEIANFGDTTSQNGSTDADGDGLTNAEEYRIGSNPNSRDSDGDGVEDALEVAYNTDPVDDSSTPVIEAPIFTSAVSAFTTVGAVDGSDKYVAELNGVTMTLIPQSTIADPAVLGLISGQLGVVGSTGGSKARQTVGDFETLVISFDKNVLLKSLDVGNCATGEMVYLTSTAFDGLSGVAGGVYSDAADSIANNGDLLGLDDDNSYNGILLPAGTVVKMTVGSGHSVSYKGITVEEINAVVVSEAIALDTVIASVKATDSEPSEIINYTIAGGNDSGLFTIDSNGQVRVTGVLDYETESQFILTIKAVDLSGLTAETSLLVEVKNVNESPVAAADSAIVAEDGAVVVEVLANDADVDSVISVSSVTQGSNGTVSTDGTTVTYTPAPDYNGEDAFTYTVTDGELAATAAVSVKVNAVNDIPVAVDDSAVVDEDHAVTVAVLTNDSDVDSELSVKSVTQGANGTVSTNGITVTYTPVVDYNGSDSFTYTVTDGELTATATVTVTVNSVVDIAVVSTSAASSVDVNTATANYTITDTGDENPTVTLYYGLTDKGQTENWDKRLVIGSQPAGNFTSELSGLIDNMGYFYTIKAVNSAGTVWGNTQAFTTIKDAMPKLYHTVINSVGTDSWVRVNLPNYYHSMIVVATPRYENAANASAVTRITNAGHTSFDLIVQRIDDGSGTFTAVDVDVMVVEEGAYTAASCGVDMEAFKHHSTTTAYKGTYNNDQIIPVNTYAAPVVFGQVMSLNDSRWSTFWACDGARKNIPDAEGIYIGKAVGEDPEKTRNNETLGYIIIESGVSSVNGIKFEAAVGADIVRGIAESPSYDYNLTDQLNTVSGAVLSVAAYDGADMGAPVLYGATPVTTSTLGLAWIEDSKTDAEQVHGTEQVAYIVFE